MNPPIETAAVVGAGIMGHGVAQLLAQHGVQAALIDTSTDRLDRARGWIEDNTNYMAELGVLDSRDRQALLDRISCTTDLSHGLGGAGYVLEAVTEDLELKRDVWRQLDSGADPSAILASNTSSYDIDEVTDGVSHPERVLGTHWFHPPQITPCVEVIAASRTSAETLETVTDFLTRLGKAPTPCANAPGFVANRIQFAMVREAMALVEEGLATPAEVDRIVKTSFGFRLGAYGPFEIIDQAGADTYGSVFEYLYSKLPREHFEPPPLLRDQVEAGKLGLKSGAGFYDYGAGAADTVRRERDRKLYARLQIVQDEGAAAPRDDNTSMTGEENAG